jgi:hypothetical protein
MKRGAAALGLLALGAGGCDRLLGVPAPSLRSGDGGNQPPDAGDQPDGSGSTLVTITAQTVHHLENGDVEARADDPATIAIEAFQRSPAGFSDPIPAMLVDEDAGTYVIDGVPPGDEYYVRYTYLGTSNQYLVTRARSLDLGSDRWGRPAAELASSGTTLVFDLTQMTAWQANDSLLLVVANAGGASSIMLDGIPEVGDTSLTGLTLDWAGQPLIRTSLGDSVRLLHLTSRPVGPRISAQVVADQYLVDTSIDQTDGGPTALTGGFSLLPASSSTPVHWRLGELVAALQTSGGPAYTEVSSTLEIGPGQIPGLPILEMSSARETDVDLGSVSFANPFPGIPGPIRSATVSRGVLYQIPGASQRAFLDSYTPWITLGEDLADADGDVRPLVHPPIDVRINDQPLDQVPPVISASLPLGEPLVVTWRANPASPSPPTSYLVRIFALFRSTAGETARRRVMSIETGSPGFTVPPGVLEAGQYYGLLVTSKYAAGLDESAPRRYAIPSSEAQIVTGLFSTYDPELPDAGPGVDAGPGIDAGPGSDAGASAAD